MCGLFGVASTYLTDAEQQYFCILGTVSQLRGIDSTGIMWCKRDKDNWNKKTNHYVKRATVFSHLYPRTRGLWNADNRGPCVLAGHTRAATKGAITDELAHPFVHGSLCGMHNGTIGKYGGKDGSDSSEVYERIHNNGLVDTLEDIAYGGAYALVWMDATDMTLNFVKNHERTLFYVFNKHKSFMMWASEQVFLEFAMAKHTHYKEWGEIQKFENYQHYTMKMGSLALEVEELKLPFRETKRSTLFDRSQSGVPLYNHFWDEEFWKETEQEATKTGQEEKKEGTPTLTELSKVTQKVSKKQKQSTPGLPGLPAKLEDKDTEIYMDRIFNNVPKLGVLYDSLPHPNNRHAKDDLLRAVLDKGCTWCSTPIPLNVQGIARSGWYEDECICEKCLNTPDNYEMIKMYAADIYIPDYTFKHALESKAYKPNIPSIN